MKAVRVNKPMDLEVVEIEEVQISKPNEIKVQVKATGVCGSDVGIYKGTNPMAVYPRIIGHEMSGQIVEVGEDVKNFKIGDRVVIDPVVDDPTTPQSLIGRPNIAVGLQVRGVHIDGFMSEYTITTEQRAYKIPEGISFEEAALIEPFSIGANSCARAEVSPRDIVFVNGAGTIGQTVLRTAVLRGARVIVSDIDNEKLEIAKKNGVYKTINIKGKNLIEEIYKIVPNGVDVAIDAVCTVKSFEEMCQIVAPAGRVITLGFTEEPSQIQAKWITAKELDIRGSRLSNRKFPEVIRYFEDNRISREDMISHKFNLQDAQKAFDLSLNPNEPNKKILITY